jgi:hypothetical protein
MILISEPATLVTDLVMASLAFAWAGKLAKSGRTGAQGAWARAFMALALASLVGGIFHGFQLNFPESFNRLLWRATLAIGSASSFYMLLAGASQFDRPERQQGWHRVGIAKFILGLAAGAVEPVFLVVLVDFSVTMLLVTGLVLSKLKAMRVAGARFLAGVLLFFVGGLVQHLQLAPHPSFNHNDLFHVIQIAGNLMFYQCALRSKPAAS